MPKGEYDRSKAKSHKEPGANRKALINALAGYKKPRVDTKDPRAIAERIEEYLNYCMENDLAPGINMCANWLGVNPSALSDWYTGKYGTPEHQRVAARFYGIVQGVWEQDMHEGTINPVSGIFYGKAFYGYKDTQEIVVQHTASEQLSIADLIAEAKRLPGAETFELTDNSSSSTIDADFSIVEQSQKADPEPITERPAEYDVGYERAIAKQKRVAERKAAIHAAAEANKPILKEKKRQYLKQYYKDHAEEKYNGPRKTPEGREKHNAYMREYMRRKKAEREAAAEAERKAGRAASKAQKAEKPQKA